MGTEIFQGLNGGKIYEKGMEDTLSLKGKNFTQSWGNDGNDEKMKLGCHFAHNIRNWQGLHVVSQSIGEVQLKSVRNCITVGLSYVARSPLRYGQQTEMLKKQNGKLAITFRHPK